MLAEDEVEAELEQSGDEYENTVDQEEFNYETLEEEINDDIITKDEITDLESSINLTADQVTERFKQRKEIYDRECENLDQTVKITDLNFTVGHLSNVFYDDKYKLIMCAVPKG